MISGGKMESKIKRYIALSFKALASILRIYSKQLKINSTLVLFVQDKNETEYLWRVATNGNVIINPKGVLEQVKELSKALEENSPLKRM